jgi:hypothetical protein
VQLRSYIFVAIRVKAQLGLRGPTGCRGHDKFKNAHPFCDGDGKNVAPTPVPLLLRLLTAGRICPIIAP